MNLVADALVDVADRRARVIAGDRDGCPDEGKLSARKSNRLENYDYSQNGAYFVTLCAKEHAEIFGRIVGATVPGRPPHADLSELGQFIDEAILCNIRDNVSMPRYVIIPNHVYMIVVSVETGDRGEFEVAGDRDGRPYGVIPFLLHHSPLCPLKLFMSGGKMPAHFPSQASSFAKSPSSLRGDIPSPQSRSVQ
jgi:hypothetical protein